jgi:hypothetical protein
MKIGLRSDNGAEDWLRFAQQIGADGASIWASACPGYTERCYLALDDVLEMRERFARYDLEVTGIGLGGSGTAKSFPTKGMVTWSRTFGRCKTWVTGVTWCRTITLALLATATGRSAAGHGRWAISGG